MSGDLPGTIVDYAPMLTTAFPFIVLLLVALTLRHKFIAKIQVERNYMQQLVEFNSTALEQSKNFETMVAKQYRETNERSERALTHAVEALKLQAAALEQLTAMNRTLRLIAPPSEPPAQ